MGSAAKSASVKQCRIATGILKNRGNKMFGLLRVIRGFFGFIAAWQVLGLLPVLSWLQDLSSVNGYMIAILVVKILVMALSFSLFFGLRALIHKVYLNRYGIQHPGLLKKWAL
jgi:hypothetical protein